MAASRSSVPSPPASSHGNFSATRWSVVLTAAAGENSSSAQAALSELCVAYWYPLYAFARRLGYSAHDAEDATQCFFADLLARQALGAVDRGKGRFRSFLIASLKNFLAHQRERDHAQKRGGGVPPIPLDAIAAEERYRFEPADELSPDKLFDRRWALTVLDRALARLRDECEATGRAALFAALAPTLTASPAAASYAEIGTALGMSEGAVKVAAHRLRQRYRTALREEIAQTVAADSDIDAELRELLRAL